MNHDDFRQLDEDCDPRDYDLDGAFNDGYKLPPFWRYVFIIVALLIFARVSSADTVTYQSQTLTGIDTEVDGGINAGSNTINDVYTVVLTLSGPLAPNMNMQMVTPQSWTVTCSFCTMPLSSNVAGPNITATTAVFMFSTDSAGKITAWNFAISGSFLTPDNSLSGTGTFASGDTSNYVESGYGKTFTTSIAAPKGGWTQSSLSNPAPAVQVLARTCNGTWGPPSNSVAGGLTPNADGSAMNCRVPAQYPSSWYMKVTPDNGKTVQFVTLKSLGLGNGK